MTRIMRWLGDTDSPFSDIYIFFAMHRQEPHGACRLACHGLRGSIHAVVWPCACWLRRPLHFPGLLFTPHPSTIGA